MYTCNKKFYWSAVDLKCCDRNRLTDFENEFMVARGEGCGEEVVKKFGMGLYTVLYLKWITNKDLLDSTVELCSMLCGSLDGRGVEGDWIHVYVWLSPPSLFT